MKAKQLIIAGACLFILSVAFGLVQTVYFITTAGMHVLPSTPAEQTCDHITFLFMLCGGGTMVYGLGKLLSNAKPH